MSTQNIGLISYDRKRYSEFKKALTTIRDHERFLTMDTPIIDAVAQLQETVTLYKSIARKALR